MAHWLLRHNPARGELSFAEEDWVIRRYKDRVAAGDDVALWLTGKDGGVVALGTVVDAPHPADAGTVIGVAFRRVFPDAPIHRDVLKADVRFADALVLRMSGGGNPFPVTPGEWRAISERAPGHPEHTFVANTVRTAAAIAAAGATALREVVRSVAQ